MQWNIGHSSQGKDIHTNRGVISPISKTSTMITPNHIWSNPYRHAHNAVSVSVQASTADPTIFDLYDDLGSFGAQIQPLLAHNAPWSFVNCCFHMTSLTPIWFVALVFLKLGRQVRLSAVELPLHVGNLVKVSGFPRRG